MWKHSIQQSQFPLRNRIVQKRRSRKYWLHSHVLLKRRVTMVVLVHRKSRRTGKTRSHQKYQTQHSCSGVVAKYQLCRYLYFSILDTFIKYMYYVQNLKFEEKPDYNYLKNTFFDLYYKTCFEPKMNWVFDWAIHDHQ